MIVLDAKTDYSFMRGFGTPEQWLARCKEIGVTHFGVADYCSTWGHTFFRKAFKGSGVKLLYGVQLPVVRALDKDPRHSLVTLIAKHDLKPLYDLVTLAHQQAYYRPRVTWKQLEGFEGLVIIDEILPNTIPCANASASLNADIHAVMNVYPCYAPRYPGPDLRQGFQLFQAISSGQRIGEIDSDALHMLRDSEFKAKFGAYDWEALAAELADFDADIPKGTLVESGIKDKPKELRKRAMAGLKAFGLDKKKPYLERLDTELKVIRDKNFEDYFFFVSDIVGWAKCRMLVGPGRGSAGGSLLCYALGITSVDPLKFNTMFERFIDPTRPDLPDIDIDFPDNRREEVFTYMKEKYGEDRVARLGTISEFGGKSAFNDVGKATGVPLDVTREFGKYTEGVGQGVVISPARVLTMLSDEHEKLLEKYPTLKLAEMVDGHARHHGVHAAGVVVSEGSVSAFGSLTKEGVLTMDMRAAEEIGLVKMDALGLRTLSVIQTACDLAGIDPKALYDLDWEDAAVYDAVFNKDKMTGIFQFEGNAVRSLMKGLGSVERFDDICALTSLARPGPLIGGAAENWVKARKGDQEARELHPALESTFGVICYQEQMMSIMKDIGGFDIVSVQGARRAVGKKDPVKLKGYREQFVTGAANYFGKRHPDFTPEDQSLHSDEAEAQVREQAEQLWDELEEFGSYAFNLAHAVEYGMISFQTAWLKTHYPLQFAAACLRFAVDDEQGKNLLRELKEEGFEYVPFDAQKSKSSWAILEGKLYGGFDSVRGIGEKTANNLVAKRNLDPAGWLDALTESQRGKLLAPGNTPWHTLTHFGDKYGQLYKEPELFRPAYAPHGFKGPILRIRDIPEAKGNYAFVGRILRRTKRDMNEESRVAKREGKVFDKDTWFINLQVEDDTGELGGTINRFKAASFQWLLDEDIEGRDFFFRGNIIADGRKWLFIDNVVELKKETA